MLADQAATLYMVKAELLEPYRYFVDTGFYPSLNSSTSDHLSSNCSGYTPEIRRDFPSPQSTATAAGGRNEPGDRMKA